MCRYAASASAAALFAGLVPFGAIAFAFDLWSYAHVKARANDILTRLQNGSMPCDGAWPAARVEVFQRWIDTGMQP